MSDEKNQNHWKQTWYGRLAVAVAAGAAVGFVVDKVFGKKTGSLEATKETALWMGAWSLAESIWRHQTDNKEKPQAEKPPLQSPPLPHEQHVEPPALHLAQIPQVLNLLVMNGHLSVEQQQHVLTEIQKGRAGFAGEIAVTDGLIAPQQLEQTLIAQNLMKVGAALMDIHTISTIGTIPHPAWLRANWGNNGVNPAANTPTTADGFAAAANMTQNLVMLANANPDRALLPTIQQGIVAAANLARGMAQGDSPQVPILKHGDHWRETLYHALRTAVAAYPNSPESPKDAHGKPVNLDAFITARDAEISASLAQLRQTPPPERIRA